MTIALDDGRRTRGQRRETVPVTCWCEAAIVKVPTREVRAGLTHTCGRPDCTREACR